MSAADFLFDRDLPQGLRSVIYAREVRANTVVSDPLATVDAAGSVGLRPVLMRADGTHVAGEAVALAGPNPGGGSGGDVDLSGYYDKTETDALLSSKADQSALSGMVSHPEMATALTFKASNQQVNAKADQTYVDSRLLLKADKAELTDFVTTGQMLVSIANAVNDVPGADLSGYYDKTEVNAQLAQKADLGDMVGKASQTYVDSALLNKADKSEVYTKAETDHALTFKANVSQVLVKANQTYVDGELAAKADVAFVNSQLMDYVRSDLFEDAINLRVPYEDLPEILVDKVNRSELFSFATTAAMDNAIAPLARRTDLDSLANTIPSPSAMQEIVDILNGAAQRTEVYDRFLLEGVAMLNSSNHAIGQSVSIGSRGLTEADRPRDRTFNHTAHSGGCLVAGNLSATSTTLHQQSGDFINNTVLGNYSLTNTTATVTDCTVIGHNNIDAEVFRAVDTVIIGNDCVRESVGDIERSVLIGNRITNPTAGLDRTVRDCVLIGSGSLIELSDGSLIGHVRIGDHRSESVCIPAAGVAAPAPLGGVALHCDSNGNIYRETSSRRFKSDIVDVSEEDIDRYDALIARRYVVTANQRVQFGVVAEEIFEVLPELVTRDRDGVIDGVVYQQLHALAMASSARLRARVDSLEARLLALESK